MSGSLTPVIFKTAKTLIMEQNQPLFDLKIDHTASQELTETSRWSKLLAILIISIAGLVILVFLFAWNKIEAAFFTQLEGTNAGSAFAVVAVMVIIIAAIVGVIMYFLLRAAYRIKTSIRIKDQQLFNRGLNDLKTFFIIGGVFSILGLAIQLFSFLF